MVQYTKNEEYTSIGYKSGILKYLFYLVVVISTFLSCTKPAIDSLTDKSKPGEAVEEYTRYIIKKGAHYCENSTIVPLHKEGMHFKVILDSTCIYTATL